MSKPEYVEIDMLAPAKVNLGLNVSRKVDGGRHPLSTVMQSVSLFDRLHVQADWDPEHAGIDITTTFGPGIEPEDIPLEKNLVYKAIMAFCDYIGKPMGDCIHIDLQKNIPPQSGLGGGSSDCAAAIKLMAKLYALDPNGQEAIAVARSLGSDVAFFLDGGCSLLEGFGDVFVASYKTPELHIALARPHEGLSTPAVYRRFDEMEHAIDFDCADRSEDALSRYLESGGVDAQTIAGVVGNSLQLAACDLNPGVAQVIDGFLSLPGVLNASVSGSGSACYAICEDGEAAAAAAEAMSSRGLWAVACTSVAHGATW